MKLPLLVVSALCVLTFACGAPMQGAVDAGPKPESKYDSPTKISSFLEGKTLTMEGASIPTHPNGYLQDLDLGASTQCYQKVVMKVAGGNFAVTSDLGTMRGADGGAAPGVGKVGFCDHSVKSNTVSFTSTVVLIENVKGNGACFDITVTFNGFSQEGRGSVNADGTTMTLELYFGGKAANHRCADGDPGTSGVTVNSMPFSGSALQKYAIAASN
jgi:hypothetical protein